MLIKTIIIFATLSTNRETLQSKIGKLVTILFVLFRMTIQAIIFIELYNFSAGCYLMLSLKILGL